jgi:hypothetical protein
MKEARMPVSVRLSFAALLLAAFAGGQVRPGEFKRMPPEIVLPEGGPRVKVETNNDQLRAVRIAVGTYKRIDRPGGPLLIGGQGALLVAVTPLDLRFSAAGRKMHDAHLAAGETEWIATPADALQNMAEDCEFLLIESKR